MDNQNVIVKFIESDYVLEIEFLQSLVMQATEYTDWTDLVACADEIDTILTIASAQNRLCGQLESNGTIDISIALHEVKQVYYGLIAKEEFHTDAISTAGSIIMKDMLLSLDKLLAKYDAEYQE